MMAGLTLASLTSAFGLADSPRLAGPIDDAAVHFRGEP